MVSFERKIYLFLEQYPFAKKIVRDVYQYLFSIVPTKNRSPFQIVVRDRSFFGFHDKCPWSFDNKKLLSHRFSSNSNKKADAKTFVEIGYYQGEQRDNFKQLDTTFAWNWQQGAMLQWVGKDEKIAYNTHDGQKVYTKIVDLNGNLISKLDRAVAAIDHSGQWMLSYSFERMRRGAPGYEYSIGYEPEEKDPIPKNDGLYVVNIKSGLSKKLFSIKEIVELEPQRSFNESYHFFSHCLFSPSGNRFVFYHRWKDSSGYLNSRMISSDLEGKKLYIFPTTRFVSHICWSDSEHILGYVGTDKSGLAYYILKDFEDEITPVGLDQLTVDGHPQFNPVNRSFVTDTYPDRTRMQKLLHYKMDEQKVHELLSLKIPFRYRDEVRCDFHPRWDRTGKQISFDSAHTGFRSHCTISLE